MKILAINTGSSSLKFQVGEYHSFNKYQKLAYGIIRGIGSDSSYDYHVVDGVSSSGNDIINDHEDAVNKVFGWMWSAKDAFSGTVLANDLFAVGHRVVHGGSRFNAPVIISDEVLSEIESLNDLAPLHNPVSILGIKATYSILGKSFPMVAVFDTSFFHDLPEHAATYALPYDLALKYKIKRYGFHGTAHRFLVLRYGEMVSKPIDGTKVITLQLGNGCSICAIKDGKPVDISMGFTPLEGLVMGTRSGDIDPGILCFIAEKERLTIKETFSLLNEKSGLLGVSGLSHDMGKLIEHTQLSEDKRAQLALDIYCYRARKYLGAYFAALEGVDAVIFSGGIGENAPYIRSMICEGMRWSGLRLDDALNKTAIGVEARISSDDATVHAYVIPVDEEMLIARDVANVLIRNLGML